MDRNTPAHDRLYAAGKSKQRNRNNMGFKSASPVRWRNVSPADDNDDVASESKPYTNHKGHRGKPAGQALYELSKAKITCKKAIKIEEDEKAM